jgi:hypothetical protein
VSVLSFLVSNSEIEPFFFWKPLQSFEGYTMKVLGFALELLDCAKIKVRSKLVRIGAHTLFEQIFGSL